MSLPPAPVVLVHGFTQTGKSWDPVARRLRREGLAVATPDLAGHGSAPMPDGGLNEEGVRLAGLCGRATWVGYSLGGRVCLHLALECPEAVAALVLVSATAGIDDASERADRVASDERLARRAEEHGVARFLDDWLAGPLFARLGPEEANLAARLGNSAPGLAASLRHHGTGTQLPLWDRLSELSMPVLVVVGSDDEKFGELGRRLVDGIGRHARLEVMPGGHTVCFERPEEFSRLVADFASQRH